MCPKSLLAATNVASSTLKEDTSYKGRGKHKDSHNDDEGKGSKTKKPWGTQDSKKFWLENKKIDVALKSIKQSILKSHKRTNLGQLIWANDSTILETMKEIGLAATDCGCFHMWGRCYDKNCLINHNETSLTSQQNEKVNTALLKGAKNLSSKKIKQEWVWLQEAMLQAPKAWLEKRANEEKLPVVRMVTDNDLKIQNKNLQSIAMQSFVFNQSKQPPERAVITLQGICQQESGNQKQDPLEPNINRNRKNKNRKRNK